MHGLFLEVFPQYHKTLTRGRRGNQQVKQDHQSAMMVYNQIRRSSQEYSGDIETQKNYCYMKTVNLFSTTMEMYYTMHFTNYVALSNAIYFMTKKIVKIRKL